ncbi:MAG: zinc ABC transporter substrate-binding protein [Campylobacterales bacterium]|nr:zinc ABC transporter substrate-binding protein [Campylobacterales bacterium]
MSAQCKKQNKKLAYIFGIIIAAIAFYWADTHTKKPIPLSMKPIVSVSTFTLYEVAHAVAGETLEINSIIPLGSDAHTFSPTPSQVAALSNSTLFIYSGAGFETWAQPLKNSLPQSVRVVDMSKNVTLLKRNNDSDHGVYDPHYWLDIDNMIHVTQSMEKELSTLFPANAPLYHTNTAVYTTKLEKLKSDYSEGLKTCKNRTLITNHDAFGYLAHENQLKNISVIGLSSDEQPSAKMISEIILLVKKEGVKTIFFEELIDDHVSQTIAQESGAKAQSLQPLENISEAELKSHQTYESLMRDNLAKLREAMECR